MSTVVLPSRQSSQTVNTQPNRQVAAHSGQGDRLIQLMRSVYQADHQVKLLHLHAEVDTLFHQLKASVKQRQN